MMTWNVSSKRWCPNCHSEIFSDECDRCDDVTEEKFEQLKGELRKLDIGAMWRFVGVSDGENEMPSLREIKDMLLAVQELNQEIEAMKERMSDRGYRLDD